MIGYNARGEVVYSDCVSGGDFYDCEHVWDKTEAILSLGLVRVAGEKFDDAGNVEQSWETTFSETGEYVGSRTTQADGKVVRHGAYGAA